MNDTLLKDYKECAETLADKAGEIVRGYFRSGLEVEGKEDASPVTQADRETEEAMRRVLIERYPDHGIFGEEGERVNSDAEWQWILDPIDGTLAFIAGYPTFTTLIALTYQGEIQLGIIDQPINRERWIGMRGETTTLNGKSLSPLAPKTLPEALLAATSPDYFKGEKLTAFNRVKNKCAKTIFGGDAYIFAMLASGSVDAIVETQLQPYDFAALIPVVKGIGGVITDWQGKPLTMESNGDIVAASSKALHTDILKEVMNE